MDRSNDRFVAPILAPESVEGCPNCPVRIGPLEKKHSPIFGGIPWSVLSKIKKRWLEFQLKTPKLIPAAQTQCHNALRNSNNRYAKNNTLKIHTNTSSYQQPSGNFLDRSQILEVISKRCTTNARGSSQTRSKCSTSVRRLQMPRWIWMSIVSG